MKGSSIYCFFILTVLFVSAGKQDAYSQARYKGGRKHAPPASNILPDPNNNYHLNTPISGSLKDSLDKQVNDVFAITGMPGISAALLMAGKGLWVMDTGFISRPEQRKVDSTTLFYWASVAKMITATIIATLVEEHKLSYDSKLSDWYPQFQNATKITIDELLKHTSGLYSFNTDSTFHYSKRYYAPQELFDLIKSNRNLFPPGEYWSYSNTGYLLLALIAEKIEAKTFAQIVQERIAAPLHLTSLRALAPGEQPANLALAHVNCNTVAEDYSTPLGAGNIISNARDMVVLLYSLLTGKISTPGFTNDRLIDLYPMFEKGMYYGRGIMLSDFNEINQTNDYWIGHSGGTEDYRALLVYDSATKAFVAVAVNQRIPVEAIARKLLGQIK